MVTYKYWNRITIILLKWHHYRKIGLRTARFLIKNKQKQFHKITITFLYS